MATKTTKKVKKLEKAKKIVKKINSDLIDASFDAIQTTVKTGEKWQKLTSKLIKKAEPLTKQQINMFVETAETIKGQLENSTDRLKNLVGYDSEMFDQAKKMVSENPLTQRAEKITTKLKKEITETIEDITEDVKDKVEDITEDVKEKFEDVLKTKKKAPAKKAKAKKPVAKKTTVKKPVAKKTIVKKPAVKKTTVKNDLKVIKGIGPKMEILLNENGITSFEELSKITVKKLEAILTNAGMNTKMYNIADWKTQAKLEVK